MIFKRKARKSEDHVLAYTLEFVKDKIENFKAVRVHRIFADIKENLSHSILAIDTKKYELVSSSESVNWDSDFLFLVSCELIGEIQIFILKMPFEYLDNPSVVYKTKINDIDYIYFCEKVKPFSTYIFKDSKLTEAFTDTDVNLFDRYDLAKYS